ncbi:hypothetical protein SARC_11182 [Sphaeroforma arctica JP610]|uniref:Rad4/PNGase transglutaminase-like fold domain-containing protein n=1 Tax=Sphaeroforma arctica JP610 TaxID=667725 RepID=A0A0L0FHS5_9EUKA|nr:hypothetical protein SARC_11182 [Sphaeroforma arctica JP610]KNC76310.1 hypothetical protein SARC_11182 [Sphaeroforma arctica JP610]|eukprot:XP_014150212.1 hypothetical protein SARC_11182 [Sphaeroforma arctica JP610]
MAISAQSLDRDQWVSVFVVICRLAGLKTRLVQSFTHLTPVKVPKSVNQAIDRAFSGDVEGQAETSSGKRRRMHTQEIQDSHADTYTHTQADTNTHTDTQTQTNTQTQSGRERGMHGTVDDAHGTTTPPDGQAQANGSGKQRMVVSLADTTRLNARTQLRLKGKWNKDLLGNEGEGSSSCSNAQTDTNTDTYTHTHIDTTDAAHADRDRHTRTRTETNAMTIGTDINSDSARAGDIDRTSGIDSRWVSTRSSMRTGRSAQRSSAQASRSATKSDTDLPSIDTWVEVYVRNSNARNKRLWTTVNPIVLNIEPIPTSRLHQPVVYVLGVDESGEVKDVTERYAEKWLTETQRLRLPESLWSGYVLGPYLPKNARADQEENAVMALGHQKKGWPTIAGFRSHPLYALERHCNKRHVYVMYLLMTPKYGGVVILSENAGVLNDAWIQQRMEKERLAESKREQTVLNKWRRMSRFLLIRDRLRKGQVVRDAAQEKFTAKFAVSLSDSDSN